MPNQIAVSQFFGRKCLLEDLQAYLLRERGHRDKSNAIVLQAMGGQGKSQIALELCRRLKKQCRGTLWLDATSKAAIERSFETIAQKMTQNTGRVLEDTDAKVKFVLDTLQEWKEQWLVVYDNYDHPDVFSDIKQFLPECESCLQGSIFITDRY